MDVANLRRTLDAHLDCLSSAAQLIAAGRYLDALRTAPPLRALLDCAACDAAADGVDGADGAVHDAESYYRTVGGRAAAAVEAAAAAGLSADEWTALGSALLAGVACLHVFLQYNLTGPSAGPPPPSPLDLFAPPAVAKHFAKPPPAPAGAGAASSGAAGVAAAIAAVLGKAAAPPAAAALSSDAGASAPSEGTEPAGPVKDDGLGGLGVDSSSAGDLWAREQLQLDGEDLVGRCPALQWLLLARVLLLRPMGLLDLRAATAEGEEHREGAEAEGRQHGQAEEAGAGAEEAGRHQAGAEAEAGPGSVRQALARLAPSWPWWALRTVSSCASALDGRSHSLLSAASTLIRLLVGPESPCPWGAAAAANANADSASADAETAALGGVLCLEVALVQLSYGYAEAGRQYLERSGGLLGLRPGLSGALGVRTVHQVDPKAQLVVVTSQSHRAAPPSRHPGQPTESLGLDASSSAAASSSSSAAAPATAPAAPAAPGSVRSELEGLTDESDVFPAPRLLGEGGALLETSYSPPEQALLLGWALAVKKETSADDLQVRQRASARSTAVPPAFAALSEAVKHKRDSWQAWENYARAALASGHYQAAVRGLQRSLQLSGGQRLFVDVASGLLDALEGRPPPADAGTSPAAAAAAAAEGLLPAGLGGGGGDGGTAAAAVGDSSLQEDEAALGVPLLPLLSDAPLPGRAAEADDTDAAAGPSSAAETDGGAASSTSAAASDQPAAAAALLSGREREVVLGGLGSLLREGVNGPAAGPALWGCLARYWALRGEADSAKEARLKQVRALAGGAFKSDPARFAEYADASEQLGRAYLACFRLGRPGGVKDLAAGRMHLRGLLRTTAEAFGEHPATARLQALLEEITRLEDEAIAAARAARDAA
ncbi:hypothetical protein GPECTOR_8g312 [Gonium pectorale]|uniref:Uncharacterized protein n=1 Tax=Gonium pectorale TaxID=33097 RepID=A0A150GSW1_GONPE|nr:hypothetical protein GPECTOR_8g312 [Gonium pectorale]|eukprot:KXZ52937.1 hypothetical protein GPECTOR_8g312 [Gonium pectorale]